jgi:lipocalin
MLESAKRVDLSRYVGKWNEVAALPTWFERDITSATAKYTQREGYVEVLNKSYKGGKLKGSAEGKAVPTSKPNVLRVSFGFIWSDYIIEFVDKGYRYAIVGSKGNRYLWILARELPVKQAVYDFLVAKAKAKGYNADRLVMREKAVA